MYVKPSVILGEGTCGYYHHNVYSNPNSVVNIVYFLYYEWYILDATTCVIPITHIISVVYLQVLGPSLSCDYTLSDFGSNI